MAREITGALPLFLDSFDRYNRSLTDYQIVKSAISKGRDCILYGFSVVQLRTFQYDFSGSPERMLVYDGTGDTPTVGDYLERVGSGNGPSESMKPVNESSTLELTIDYCSGTKKHCTIEGEPYAQEGDFSCFRVVPQNNRTEVTLKVLSGDSVTYDVRAFRRLVETSMDGSVTSSVRSILPNFLVYSGSDCVGYGYDTPPNANATCLKSYLNTKANTNDPKRTFKELLKVAKRFLCTVSVFQSYDMYLYGMDLEDFKVVLDDDGDVVDVLPISCESICIEGVATSSAESGAGLSKVKQLSGRCSIGEYQSYFADVCTMYTALKIVTLNGVDGKSKDGDYRLLKSCMNSLKFSCNPCIGEAFNAVSWRFFDEVGDVFVDNGGHVCFSNLVKVLNLCEFESRSILGKFTKKALFAFSVVLSFVCVASLVVILYLIL
jgi:hypothetical protein